MTDDVVVSSPDRIIFPEPGWTKADVVDHYRSVSGPMLGFAEGRPLTLQRFPKGLAGKGFMQKNAAKHYPESIARHEVPTQDGGSTLYPVVDRPEHFAYLANHGTVTFHCWTATAADPEHPDRFIIDLDPDEGDIDGVRAATRVIGDLCDEFGMESFPVATGSSGFHVWVKLDGSADREEVVRAARAMAGLAACRNAEVMTTEFLKKDREGRVFIDWLRNGPIATVVVPFSLRPKPAAPVAVPLTWDEVATAVPDQWTLGSIDDRMEISTDVRPAALDVNGLEAAAREAGADLDTPFDRFGRR